MSVPNETTVTETTVVTVSPTYINDVTVTVTSHMATTLLATQGQLITLTSPSVPASTAPTTKYTPTVAANPTSISTVTLTEIDVYLQNLQGEMYSTWIVPLPPAPPTADGVSGSGGLQASVYVVEPHRNNAGEEDWDNWSRGERAGLIVGVVLSAFLIFSVIWWCCRRSNIWFAHGWWPWMGQQSQMPPTQGPAPLPPGHVNASMMPYGYAQPYGGVHGTR